MKCPKCANDMIHSKAGWLCVECGHVELSDSPETTPASPAIAEVIFNHSPGKTAEVKPSADSKDDENESDSHPAINDDPPKELTENDSKDKKAHDDLPGEKAEAAEDDKKNETDQPVVSGEVPAEVLAAVTAAAEPAHAEPAILKIDSEESPESVLAESIEEIEHPAKAPSEISNSVSELDTDSNSAPSDTAAEPALLVDPTLPADVTNHIETPSFEAEHGPDSLPTSKDDTLVESPSNSEPAVEKTPAPEATTQELPASQNSSAEPVINNAQTPVAPTPPPLVADTPLVTPPTASTAPTAMKPPLQPVTHPKPLSRKRLLVIIAVVVALLMVGISIGLFSLSASKKSSSSEQPVKLAQTAPASPSPESVVQGSNADNSDPAVNNAQRQTVLATYASAYKATAQNGYYAVNPPAVAVNAKDPSTKLPYVISKSPTLAIGQIRYWPGGSCTGAARTPGSNGSKYLALQTLLEGTQSPYCLDVK